MKSPSVLKQKMQNVSFNSVDDFMEFLPADELEMVNLIRKVIFSCMPEVSEKLSYNVPFYKRHKGICFIWPASVLWGKKKTYEGVRLGFIQGHLMQDDISWLNQGVRKYVCYRDFKNVMEIDLQLLRTYIFEAMIIDDQRAGKNTIR